MSHFVALCVSVKAVVRTSVCLMGMQPYAASTRNTERNISPLTGSILLPDMFWLIMSPRQHSCVWIYFTFSLLVATRHLEEGFNTCQDHLSTNLTSKEQQTALHKNMSNKQKSKFYSSSTLIFVSISSFTFQHGWEKLLQVCLWQRLSVHRYSEKATCLPADRSQTLADKVGQQRRSDRQTGLGAPTCHTCKIRKNSLYF